MDTSGPPRETSKGEGKLAILIAKMAADKPEGGKPADKPEDDRWAKMGNELLAAVKKGDGAALGRLLRAQLKIAVSEASKDR